MVRLPRADKRTRDAFADLDIAGYNYMIGRYRSEAKRHPHRVIVGTETAPTDTVEIWHLIKDRPNIIGDFTWTGWDYIGEAGLAAVRTTSAANSWSPTPPAGRRAGHRHHRQPPDPVLSQRNRVALAAGPHLAVRPVNHATTSSTTHWRNTDSIRSWSWEGCEGRPRRSRSTPTPTASTAARRHRRRHRPAGRNTASWRPSRCPIARGPSPRLPTPRTARDRSGHPHQRGPGATAQRAARDDAASRRRRRPGLHPDRADRRRGVLRPLADRPSRSRSAALASCWASAAPNRSPRRLQRQPARTY